MVTIEKSGAMARSRMVERQLKARGIDDGRVLNAFEQVPRHFFVEPTLRFQAYEDCALPIGQQQTISQPYIVAVMTQHLRLHEKAIVLDVGTGTGYQAAILSRIARVVYSVERLPGLVGKAKERLASLGYDNILVKLGDGWQGWREFAPYDAIVVAAWSPKLPEELFAQLKPGGRMILPIGNETYQELHLYVREEQGPKQTILGPCAFVPFVSASCS